MRRGRYYLLAGASLCLGATVARAEEPAGNADAQAQAPGDIVVTGVADPQSAAATGLKLTLSETPQSVTIVDQQRIRDFQLNSANDLLDQVVGINVERAETDRTQFNSRGFDVTNFQVDGIGLPLVSGIQFGDLDTALFERVEAVRGADAMMTGIGNPSATINFVRKRPTDTFQAYAAAQGGSWNDWRLEGDVSGPLDRAGKLSMRAIVAHEETDSYLRYNHVNRDVAAGLLAWKPVEGLKLTAGYSRQRNDADGVLWGALPLLYSNGEQIDLPRSTTTSAPWTFWNVTDESVFGEAAVQLGGGWSARGVFTYRHIAELSKLLYAFGAPDPVTGLGVGGMSGIYPTDQKQYLWDGYASGPFALFGRTHQLALGVSTGRAHLFEYEGFSEGTIDYPALGDWGDTVIPEPVYPDPIQQTDTIDRLTRVYAAAHLDIADPVKAVVGGSGIWLKSTGSAYGVDQSRKASRFSPYAGLTIDLASNLKLYGSYTDIFNPQSESDINRRKLDPAHGTSLEAGLKASWFGGRLYAIASLFRGKQSGLASYLGTFDDGKDYYEGVDTTAKGVEFEVAGRITPNWTANGGVTFLSIKDDGGADARTFVPRRSFKLSTSYAVPEWRNFKVGAQFRAQSGILTPATSDYGDLPGDFFIRQKAYAVLGLFAGIDLIDRLHASVNVENVTNTKYLNSLMWGQAFYAAPRNVRATLSFSY